MDSPIMSYILDVGLFRCAATGYGRRPLVRCSFPASERRNLRETKYSRSHKNPDWRNRAGADLIRQFANREAGWVAKMGGCIAGGAHPGGNPLPIPWMQAYIACLLSRLLILRTSPVRNSPNFACTILGSSFAECFSPGLSYSHYLAGRARSIPPQEKA